MLAGWESTQYICRYEVILNHLAAPAKCGWIKYVIKAIHI